MEMPPPFLVVEELRFHGNAIEIILLNVFYSTAFKSPSVIQNSAANNQAGVSFRRNVKVIGSAFLPMQKNRLCWNRS